MKVRVLSAIIMLIIVIPLLIIGGLSFKLFAILLACCSMYELMKCKNEEKKVPFTLQLISYLLIITTIYFNKGNYSISYIMLVIIFMTLFLPIIFINNNDKYNIIDALYLACNVIFLGFAFNLFIIIRSIDINYIIYLALITIITDTFALVTGNLIGKHKLCEKISPKKTIEGAIGGSLVGTFVASMFYLLIINPSINIFLLIGITLLFTIIGQIGDLFFSSIKRYYKIKDFSNLIPGHGGILDRLDSFIFVIILYTIFMSVL